MQPILPDKPETQSFTNLPTPEGWMVCRVLTQVYPSSITVRLVENILPLIDDMSSTQQDLCRNPACLIGCAASKSFYVFSTE
ncbi:hypothetical protein KIN20_029982 [Parelaphostrongylus tenuis]|uniref:Uncharacterized protein n=1 Tax=Parelaphostrongylus tenuis TaxID=148309 RepID=A0AAD5WGH3_PARTN|nr:hypothetical protein KIN20_029982 [Parelaphostrongylus tenuis]